MSSRTIHPNSSNEPSPPARALLLGAVVFLALPGTLPADEPRFDYVERISVEDGLSHSTVWDIHQDRRGYLWLGTAGELNRYDGYEFKVYRHDPDDPESLSASEVLVLHEDRQGSLWLGTRGRGLNRFDPSEERFERYEHDPEDPKSLLGNRVWALLEDRSGTLTDGAAGEVSEAVKANLSMIVGSGRRLGQLVNDILDYSRLTHKSLELRRRPVDLRPLAEVILTLQGPLATDKDLEL